MESCILLVDDEVRVLSALKRVLQRAGFEVATALSVTEALDYLQTNNVSVIITDFRMPQMSGADLLRQVKKDWPDIISLVLSGYTDFELVVELLNQGLAVKFLQKPWNETELVKSVVHAQKTYSMRVAKIERDQFLLGSLTALIEIRGDGIISRFNAPAQSLFPELTLCLNKPLESLDPAQHKDTFSAFLKNKSDRLFITSVSKETKKQREFIIERCWSDDFCHLLKLSDNLRIHSEMFKINGFDELLINEAEFYQQLNTLEDKYCDYTVIFIGIAKFDLIEDLLDFQHGEALTELLAKMLHTTFGSDVRICHKYSDHFMFYVPSGFDDCFLLSQFNKLVNLFTKALPKSYERFSIELYGVYGFFPEDRLSAKELVNHLGLNMNYLAKNQQHFFSRYDAELVNDYREKFELSRLLFKAIENNEFSLYFQPKIDIKTNKVSGAEVLIRWYETTKFGWVSPALFIPIAECDGQIIAISRYVITQSFKQLKRWHTQNIETGKLAINLSARQIKDDPSWIDFMLNCLKENGISSSDIQFELTETYLMEDMEQCQRQIDRLRSLGFEVQIDDFGVGYSSLAYLSKLSIDGVKLDKALITGLESSLEMQSMIRNIVRMSHDLNLKVIAEGVETTHEYNLVKKLGCDYIQGYYFSKPLNEKDFCDYIYNQNNAVSK